MCQYVKVCVGHTLSVTVDLLVPVPPGSPRWTVTATWPSVCRRWTWTWPGEPTGCWLLSRSCEQPRCLAHSAIISHGEGHTQRAAHCSARYWHLKQATHWERDSSTRWLIAEGEWTGMFTSLGSKHVRWEEHSDVIEEGDRLRRLHTKNKRYRQTAASLGGIMMMMMMMMWLHCYHFTKFCCWMISS